jgi:hypothetical protein
MEIKKDYLVKIVREANPNSEPLKRLDRGGSILFTNVF